MKTSALPPIALAAGLCILACSSGEDGINLPPIGAGAAGGALAGASSGGTAGGAGSNTGGLAGTAGSGNSAGTAGSAGAAASGGRAGSGGGGAGGGSGGAGAAGSAGATGGEAGSTAGGGQGGAAGGGGRFGGNAGRAGSGGAAGASGGGGAGAGGASGSGGSTFDPDQKFVGNITTGNSIDTGGMKFSKYWDQITPENAGKWGSVQSQVGGSFNWATLDAVYAYAQTNGIIFKQHNFVWGSQQPRGTPTVADVENWIKSFCERFPNTPLIDVVNEPPPHTTPNYTSNLGQGESGTWGWITKAFKLAHQHCPNAILILNDYNNLEYSDQENHFIDIVTQIKAAGAPIHAAGCQAHAVRSMSASALQNAINTMASKTGLPIYITEYDVPDGNDQNQLKTYQTQMPIFLNTESVKGVTVWGWIVGRTWVSNSGLVNGTSPRPAMTWLMQQLGRPVPPN